MTKCVIIVTYEPELNNLKRLTECAQAAGFLPIISDNSEKHPVTKPQVAKGSQVICMGGNAGIAAAQNAGIRLAKKLGADVIGFFDQDSQADEKLLGKLEEALYMLGECVVSPLALEKGSLEEYPVQTLNRFGYPKDVFVKGKKSPQKVDLVISSGMMTFMSVFEKVGNYEEDFFIDFVDVEWCLRCKKAKVPVYVIPDAVLMHKIGNENVSVGEMNIVVHSAVRTYYKVRNSFLLFYKKAGVIFTIRQILPALLHNFLLIFSVKDKGMYAKYYFLGIIHGICGVRGKYKGGKKNAS